MDSTMSAVALVAEAAFAEALPTMTYDVVRHRGHWKVLHVGKHSQPHPNQQAAIESAMKLAKEGKAAGRSVVVRLNRTDGQVFDLLDDGDQEVQT